MLRPSCVKTYVNHWRAIGIPVTFAVLSCPRNSLQFIKVTTQPNITLCITVFANFWSPSLRYMSRSSCHPFHFSSFLFVLLCFVQLFQDFRFWIITETLLLYVRDMWSAKSTVVCQIKAGRETPQQVSFLKRKPQSTYLGKAPLRRV